MDIFILIECWYTLLVPAVGRQRQVDLCEYEASLVYIVRPSVKNIFILKTMCVHNVCTLCVYVSTGDCEGRGITLPWVWSYEQCG